MHAGLVDRGGASVRWSIVPTPAEMIIDDARSTVNVQNDGWIVVEPSTDLLSNEAQYLSGEFSPSIVSCL